MLYVKNLRKSYYIGKTEYPVLKGVNLHVAQGEFVAVMGPSGSGKTTLLNCISCYIPYDNGVIALGGQKLGNMDDTTLAKIRYEKLGFVFQDFMLLDGLTFRENMADQLIRLFGIEHIQNKYPAEVSGGERQRTAVARSLINNPLLLLADEPTGNLDSKASRNVIESFEEARTQLGATIFMVTHDAFSASFCDRVIFLKDGLIYKQLEKHSDRSIFHSQLLDTLKEMSGND